MTYDEITTKGIAYAQVIKSADPTAVISGPTISGFNNYFLLRPGYQQRLLHRPLLLL